MLDAELAVKHIVAPPDVLVQLPERPEGPLVPSRALVVLLTAYGAAVLEQSPERVLYPPVFEADPVPPLHPVGLVLHLLEGAPPPLAEDHLGQLLPADGAVILRAQHPEAGGALGAHVVVAAAHSPDGGAAQAHRAVVLAALGHKALARRRRRVRSLLLLLLLPATSPSSSGLSLSLLLLLVSRSVPIFVAAVLN